MAVDPQVGSSDRDAETMEELLGDRSAGVLPLRDASGGGTDVAVGDRVVAAVSNPKVPTVASAAAQPLRDQREEEPLPQPAEGQRPSLRDQMRQGDRTDDSSSSRRERACVLITGLDKERGRISLSIERPEEDRGRALHISEHAPRRIETPSELVHSGDLVRVRVVAIDAERRRLSFSIGQAPGNVVYATRTDQDANV